MLFFSFSVWQQSQGSYFGLKIHYSLQVYLEVEPSGSQLGEKPMNAMYSVNGAACVNPTEEIEIDGTTNRENLNTVHSLILTKFTILTEPTIHTTTDRFLGA